MRSVHRTFSTLALLVTAIALPFASSGAQQATTVCKDGSPSSVSGRGACSGHGGVDASATSKARSDMKMSARTAATVSCGDGTSSTARRGACSHHGGVRAAGTAAMNAPAATPMRTTVADRASRASSRPEERTNTTPMTPSSSTTRSAVAHSGSREDNNPTGAVAKCKDGLYSHAKSHQGACGHHGGVAQWIG